MLATASIAAVGWVGVTATPALAAPFDPAVPAFWVSQSEAQSPTLVYEGLQAAGRVSFDRVGDQPSGATFNAMGFRSADGYLWAIGGGDGSGPGLVRIGDDGAVAEFPSDLPEVSREIDAGAFGEGEFADRLLATSATLMETMYIIDVTTGTVETQALTHGDTVGEMTPAANDWTAYAGYLWGGQRNGGYIVRVDPGTGIIDMFEEEFLTAEGPLGAAWTYGNGHLAFSDNETGDISQVQVDDPSSDAPSFRVVSIVPGPASARNDGANSPGAPTDLGVVKTAPPTVGPGGTIDWGIEVTNHAATNSSGFTFTDAMPEGVTNVQATGSNADLCTVTGLSVSCIGDPLVAGASVSYSFTGTAPVTDVTLVNTATVVANEEDPVPGNNTDTSTTVVVVPAPHLAIVKSSDAGAAGLPGQVIDYTVAVTNDGTADYTTENPAQLTDDLSDVLDDTTWNDNAAVAFSDGSTSAAPALAGNTLGWSGPLKVGETATISYSVTVTNAGNHSIVNNACVPNAGEDAICASTNTQLPNLAVSKTVDPVSGTTVIGGQELTYTLTYANTGLAPATVDDVDTLTGLLDDADITTDPAASDPSLSVSGIADGAFGIEGTVAGGTTVTVSYEATVKPDATRPGDNSIVNWLLPAGTVPPTDCAAPECTINPVPDIADAKSVDVGTGTTVTAGELLTYTLTFTNSGTAAGAVSKEDILTHVLDDATLTSGPTASDPDLTAILDGERIGITGTLQPDQTVTVTYQVRINPDGERGDNQVSNFLLAPGSPAPPPICDSTTGDCTYNPIPNVGESKTVDPASGTTVNVGDLLTYTLTFTNDGTAAGPVASDDVLTDVLDDATLTSGPTVSDSALTAELVGDRLEVTGNLVGGQTVTVTYAVTVESDAARGNDSIANFLVEAGDDPPASCDPASGLCTVNPIPHILDTKGVNPTSGTTVLPDDVLTYTLTFENIGTGAGAVAKDDALADVLDDAALTTAPVSSDPDALTATLADDRIAVTGNLAAGQTVTITYQVTVLPDGQRGNDLLSNFLVAPGAQPPATCEGDDCTVNPIPHVVESKSVDPESGTTVVEGDTLVYTLTFSNIGTAAGDVALDDSLVRVLDDADITADPVSSDPALQAVLDGDVIHVTGNLTVGQSVTVTYAMTVLPDGERGDNVLENFIVQPGSEPPAECEADNADCTQNPVPLIEGVKGVDPASGSNVYTGEVLTYTLSFGNSGAATGQVDYTDVLTDVLDDATFVEGSLIVSDPTLSAAFDGDGIHVTGPLAVDQNVTIRYQVNVLPAAERGNGLLGNFLVKAGDTPPEECELGRSDCTVNPIPHLAVLKTSDATPTTKVGDILIYEVTVTNDGTGDFTEDSPATVTDDLSSVLDDATYNDDATATATDGSEPVVSYEEPILSWTGPLASGDSVVITYTVTTTGGGDLMVDNDACVPNAGEEPTCAVTSVGLADIDVTKEVDPASGTILSPDDTARYTLTVTNRGTGTGAFSYTDHLADVLDDAAVTASPEASLETVTVTPIAADQFTAKGLLEAGEEVTVSYTVTTKAWDEQGNHTLGNWVTETGIDPSGVCEPDDDTCTSNPIQALLANTGAAGAGLLAGTAGLLLLAGLVLVIARRRHQSAGA